MKFVALLRGVNVGGKGTIKMTVLREAFIKAGFRNVSTYINSGNIVFESDAKDKKKLTVEIEKLLAEAFFAIKTVVISEAELKKVFAEIPDSWKKEDVRKYIAFVKLPSKPEDVIREAQLKTGVDFIEMGHGVVYMTTKMEGLMSSGFPKLIAKKIYRDITIRNVNTVKKLLLFMKKN